jgi:hypothetical protein
MRNGAGSGDAPPERCSAVQSASGLRAMPAGPIGDAERRDPAQSGLQSDCAASVTQTRDAIWVTSAVPELLAQWGL